ncbi:MAG TPA: SDR family NAD(P)-dependent oxidoreductase [Mycobacterium sp.]|nr:SDR family NAD(P)-dependent oxidoreductase [Mycobacterium sp.]
MIGSQKFATSTRRPCDLGGKVALITGGTGGIGRATARELMRRGAKVAVLDMDPQTHRIAERMSPTSAMGVVADVRSRSELDAVVANVVDRFGRIDIAIANAGVLTPAGTLRVTSAAAVDSAFAVNVIGVLNTVRAAMDELITNRGQVVLISSVFAFLNGMGVIPYTMTKAAVEALGRGLRIELAAHGVTTTTAYFSLINTKMIEEGVDADPVARPAADRIAASLPGAVAARDRCRRAGRRTRASRNASGGAGAMEGDLGTAGRDQPRPRRPAVTRSPHARGPCRTRQPSPRKRDDVGKPPMTESADYLTIDMYDHLPDGRWLWTRNVKTGLKQKPKRGVADTRKGMR